MHVLSKLSLKRWVYIFILLAIIEPVCGQSQAFCTRLIANAGDKTITDSLLQQYCTNIYLTDYVLFPIKKEVNKIQANWTFAQKVKLERNKDSLIILDKLNFSLIHSIQKVNIEGRDREQTKHYYLIGQDENGFGKIVKLISINSQAHHDTLLLGSTDSSYLSRFQLDPVGLLPIFHKDTIFAIFDQVSDSRITEYFSEDGTTQPIRFLRLSAFDPISQLGVAVINSQFIVLRYESGKLRKIRLADHLISSKVISEFTEGKARVQIDNLIKFVSFDSKNNLIDTLSISKCSKASAFLNGVAAISTDSNKWILIDTLGKNVLDKAVFSKLNRFNNGDWIIGKSGDQVYYIKPNPSTNKIFVIQSSWPADVDSIRLIKGEKSSLYVAFFSKSCSYLHFIKKDESVRTASMKAKISPPIFEADRFQIADENDIIPYKDFKWGYLQISKSTNDVNNNVQVIIKNQYDQAMPFHGEYAVVQKDKEFQIIKLLKTQAQTRPRLAR